MIRYLLVFRQEMEGSIILLKCIIAVVGATALLTCVMKLRLNQHLDIAFPSSLLFEKNRFPLFSTVYIHTKNVSV